MNIDDSKPNVHHEPEKKIYGMDPKEFEAERKRYFHHCPNHHYFLTKETENNDFICQECKDTITGSVLQLTVCDHTCHTECMMKRLEHDIYDSIFPVACPTCRRFIHSQDLKCIRNIVMGDLGCIPKEEMEKFIEMERKILLHEFTESLYPKAWYHSEEVDAMDDMYP